MSFALIKALQALKKSNENSESLAQMMNQGQIAGMKVVTQAEYDALPASKTTDNTLYVIRG